MKLGQTVALAVGVLKAVDLAEQGMQRAGFMGLQPWLKSALSLVLAGAAAAQESSWRDRVVLAGAVAGGSSLLHEAHAAVQSYADRPQVVATGRRRVPAL